MKGSDPAIAAFKRIVKWLRAHPQAKGAMKSLRKPASARAIAEVEAKAKTKLPPALAALYRLHDGQDEITAYEAGDVIECGLFPSIEGGGDLPFLLVPLKELKSDLNSRMPGFRKGWIPFGSNYGGDNLVIDFASADPKRRGRVLQFNHEYGCATAIAPSFEEYLQHIADALEAKSIIWDTKAGFRTREGATGMTSSRKKRSSMRRMKQPPNRK
jgi:cell wall assembly regulator SMI1